MERVPSFQVADRILTLGSQRVIVADDLALLYGVSAKRLNEQVRRNPDRFPPDFMFTVSNQELAVLKPQFAASSWGGRRTALRVFTEHGALMAANVLNSPRAIEASIYVVRAFLKMREFASTHRDLGAKLDELERKFASHDKAISGIIETIRQMVSAPVPRKDQIGFVRSTDRRHKK